MKKIISYFWEFGDGSTSTEAAPAHLYTPGIYTVKVSVVFDDSSTDEWTEIHYVAVSEQGDTLANEDYFNNPKSYHFGWSDKTGYGWSENQGDDWIWPISGPACSVAEIDGEKLMLVWDSRDNKQYIINTRDTAYTKAMYTDKSTDTTDNGTPINTHVVTTEYTGEMLQYTLTHMETNIKMRPALGQEDFSEGLEVSFELYTDIETIPVETQNKVDTNKEVEFYFSNKKTEETTQRQLGIKTTDSKYRILWLGSYFRNLDQYRKARTATGETSMSYYSDCRLWYTRGRGYDFNRALGKIAVAGTYSLIAGPDEWSDSAIKVINSYTIPDLGSDEWLSYWTTESVATPLATIGNWSLTNELGADTDKVFGDGVELFDIRIITLNPNIQEYANEYSDKLDNFLPRY